jgi:dsRNA-specific ribonuclease
LDLGFSYADIFISKLIDEHVDFLGLTRDENFKDILMRYTQVSGYEFPIYKVIQ